MSFIVLQDSGARPKVHEPNINAVPEAKVSQETKDWLNGGGPEKREPPVPANKTQNGESRRVRENLVPQKATQGVKTIVPPQKPPVADNKTQNGESQRARENVTPQQASQGAKIFVSPQKPAPMLSNNTSTTKAEPGKDANLQKMAPQPPAILPAGFAQRESRKPRTLTILEKYDRLKAQEKTECPDLMDIDSPPSAPTNKFFDAEDVPDSLPAPLLPFHGSQQKPTTSADEEDLLQFEDLIAPGPVKARGGNILPRFTFDEGKNMPSGQPALKPVTKLGRCTCATSKPVKKTRGLTSSKWADPGYQHQGQFLRNTEMFGHDAGCPVGIEWEKGHPQESGANPATHDKADGRDIQPRRREPPRFVWLPKPKRLNPYALPFCPWGE